MGKFSKTGKHRKRYWFSPKYKRKYRRAIIIKAPQSRSSLINLFENLLAFGGTALLWAGIGIYFDNQLLAPAYIEKTKSVFIFLAGCAMVVFILSALWQYYNWFLYHGQDRRKAFPMQSLKEIGQNYGISEEEMSILQGDYQKVEVVYRDIKYYFQEPAAKTIEIVSLRKKGFLHDGTN